MCYSAQVWDSYQKYIRAFGASIDLPEFLRLYGARAQGDKIKTTKGMDDAFSGAEAGVEGQIWRLVQAHRAQEAARLEQELFKQSKRLADAERKLASRPTKTAENDQRIASDKIPWLKGKLADLRRSKPEPRDSRIFPGVYAPVMVWEDGKRVIKPMRYQCRPAGKPAFYDRRYPGTYNARRDNLEGFWKGQFGKTHGVMVAERFYENVETPEGNAVLEFEPKTGEPMLIACLWSQWHDPKGHAPDLLSFAAVTDEPEPEVAAAGHDRTVINLRPEFLDAWLNPDSQDFAALQALLDEKQHPYYEHRKAA
jgi:putative SOS response-associated peptidase YedK